jgi:cytochrome c-type biogenesis protein CcmF
MIPEIGQILLILALIFSLTLGVTALLGARRHSTTLMALTNSCVCGMFVFVASAFAVLTYAFIAQDFSVLYVANNSNSELPIAYRYTAVWGGHEGSKLLWALVLAGWTLAVAAFSRQLPQTLRARVLGTMGLIGSGFLGFLVFTSNPFVRFLPPQADGNDLNPLLQDPGMIIHPPMLYMGYVGLAVPFAFAVAALLEGKMDRQWVRWSRPWTNIAWAFLTLGIALGSWWAYYELGWGGWWFWDPVENASFMPWLIGAALIHSQAITEKRGTFINWTLLLSIAGFSLSLLGTFLVRSGILTSVHAFASDPIRGYYILVFLLLVVGAALTLFSLYGAQIRKESDAALVSKESLLLVNSIVMVSACALVLVGTLWPLFTEAFGLPKVSVGEAWFGKNFGLIVVPSLVLLPLGAFTRWQGQDPGNAFKPLIPAAIGAFIACGYAALKGFDAKTTLGLLAGFWVILGTLSFVAKRLKSAPAGQRLSLEMLAMSSAHLGIGLWLLGVVLVNFLSVERDVRMQPGASVEVGPYQVRMKEVSKVSGPNFDADQGSFELLENGAVIAVLHPQKRIYRRGNVMTEAAIDPSLSRDIYVALGEQLNAEKQEWAVRVYHKPFIRLIWLGAILMGLGGILGASERRLRQRVKHDKNAFNTDALGAKG